MAMAQDVPLGVCDAVYCLIANIEEALPVLVLAKRYKKTQDGSFFAG